MSNETVWDQLIALIYDAKDKSAPEQFRVLADVQETVAREIAQALRITADGIELAHEDNGEGDAA